MSPGDPALSNYYHRASSAEARRPIAINANQLFLVNHGLPVHNRPRANALEFTSAPVRRYFWYRTRALIGQPPSKPN